MSDDINAILAAAAAKGQQRRHRFDPRAAVRVASLERRLADERGGIGARVAMLLDEYHATYVEPRLTLLECFVPAPAGPTTRALQRVLCTLGIHVQAKGVGAGVVPGVGVPYLLAQCRRCPKMWLVVGEPYGQSEYVRLR